VLDQQRIPATLDGYHLLRQWAVRWPDRCWAVEGAHSIGRALAQRLVGDGEHVLDVPARIAAVEARIKAAVAQAKLPARWSCSGSGRCWRPRSWARSATSAGSPAHHFAAHTGTAPLEASSGQVIRHRLSRAGDRRLNHALYMMAMVQVRRPSAGRSYYQRKLAEGKSPKEALRCLKRRLSDAVYRCLLVDQHLPPSPGGTCAGASTGDGVASATCRRPGAPGARPPRRPTPGASRQCPCGAATQGR